MTGSREALHAERGAAEGFLAYNQGSMFTRAKPNFLKGDLKDCLTADVETGFTNSKVVATIGPECHDVNTMVDMLNAGMVGARIDLTWGSCEFHQETLSNLQTAMGLARKLCCTMVDTMARELLVRRDMNPEVPTYETHEAPFTINKGDTVTITTRSDLDGSPTMLHMAYQNFPTMTEPGDLIYIGRYLVCGAESASMYLRVLEVRGSDVICEAQNGATMEGMLTAFHVERSQAGMVANLQNSMPVLSERDKDVIQRLNKDYDIDFVCLSYVRDGQDVREAREWLDSVGMEDTKLMAKISTRQSLVALQPILNKVDGVVLSRGTLGLDNLPEKMAMIQKMVIKACNLLGKPVLITRLVDTMVTAPRPTRAEATDVANAVLDGADGFILGAETFRGKHAVSTVKTISNICRSAEQVFDHHYHCEHLMELAMGVATQRMPRHLSGTSNFSHDDLSATHTSFGGSSAAGGSPGSSQLRRKGPKGSLLGGSQGNGGIPKVGSVGGRTNLESACKTMAGFGMGDSYNLGLDELEAHAEQAPVKKSVASNLEAMASSAVRCADKVQASLIVVYTHTGETAQLVAKYRPQMPIVTLVVPELVSDKNRWKLVGKSSARQCLLTRGLLPMLAAPSQTEDKMLIDAVKLASKLSLVKPHQFVVCIQRIGTDVVVKIVCVDALAQTITPIDEANNFVQLPGVYASHGQPMCSTDGARAPADGIRKPQVLTQSPSMMPHALSLSSPQKSPMNESPMASSIS